MVPSLAAGIIWVVVVVVVLFARLLFKTGFCCVKPWLSWSKLLKHRALPASASGVLKVTVCTPLCGCCGNIEPPALRYLRSSSTWGTPAPSLHCLLSMPGWYCISVNIRGGAHKVPWGKPDSLAQPLSGHPPRKIQKAQGCLVSLRVGRLARRSSARSPAS